MTKLKARKVCVEAIDRRHVEVKRRNAARDCGRRPLAAREGTRHQKQTRDQTASLNDRATCSLIGSTASAIAF